MDDPLYYFFAMKVDEYEIRRSPLVTSSPDEDEDDVVPVNGDHIPMVEFKKENHWIEISRYSLVSSPATLIWVSPGVDPTKLILNEYFFRFSLLSLAIS